MTTQTLVINTTRIFDADADTGVKSEPTSDLDRLDLFAATSSGADNAIEVTGDDATASSLANPYIKVLKHVVLDTGVRIGDASSADTYIELNRSGAADEVFINAGDRGIQLTSTSMVVSQHIMLADIGATQAGKRIGDEDGDTYIDFNTATGGTDDDIIRLVSRGSVVATFGPTTNTLAGAGVDVIFGDNLGVGISAFPGDSESKAIFMTTGTTTTSIVNLTDNEIVLYSVVNTGIQNDLKIDFKTGASTKSTLTLGKDCAFPNNVTIAGTLGITGNITTATVISDATASTDKDTGSLILQGGLGVEENIFAGGTLNSVGNTVVGGTLAVTSTSTFTGATTHTGGAVFGTGGTDTHKAMGVIDAQFTVVGNVGSGEDDLMSYTLPGDTLDIDGKAVRITVWGSGNGSDNTTILLYFGALAIASINAGATSASWRCEMTVMRTGAATQSSGGHGMVNASVSGKATNEPSETLSGDVVIKVTGENTTDTTNDAVTQDGMIIEILN